MIFASRRIQHLENELATARAELNAARARLATVTELRRMESAAGMLAALGRLLPNRKHIGYREQVTRVSETLNAFTLRQPEASDPAWFDAGVQEHKSELSKDFKTPPPPTG